ncbi:hypothetical protein PVAG01_07998 [Phlyctema vagabunda]|uniref:Uncharacterized protein n=1 Tax=Phlyctema vagabunda TaxID=108571 RepID=A0ABR4PEI3_9HELO
MAQNSPYWTFLSSSRACGTLFTKPITERLTWNPRTNRPFLEELERSTDLPTASRQDATRSSFRKLINQCLIQVDEQGWERNTAKELTFKNLNPARTHDDSLVVGWAIPPGRFLDRNLTPRAGLMIRTPPVPYRAFPEIRRSASELKQYALHQDPFNSSITELYEWTARLASTYDLFAPEESESTDQSALQLFVQQVRTRHLNPQRFQKSWDTEAATSQLADFLAELHARLEGLELATKYVAFLDLGFPAGLQCKVYDMRERLWCWHEKETQMFNADVAAIAAFLESHSYYRTFFPAGCAGGAAAHDKARRYLAVAIQQAGYKVDANHGTAVAGHETPFNHLVARLDVLKRAVDDEVWFTASLLEAQPRIREARRDVLVAFEHHIPKYMDLADPAGDQPCVSLKRLVSGKRYEADDATNVTESDDDYDEEEDGSDTSASFGSATDIDEAVPIEKITC